MSLKKPVSNEEIEVHAELTCEQHVQSRYEFLNSHKGIRPNTLHGLIATTSSGKTTLLKCIQAETAKNKRIVIWLSEETIEEYQSLISEIDSSILNNIRFVEERNIPDEYKENQTAFFNYFENIMDEFDPYVIFIDNVTTSIFYNGIFGYNGQIQTTNFMMRYVKRKCSIFYAAHTESKITDNYREIITPENILGAKYLPRMTEYFYCMQKFTSNGEIYNILRVAKHRHHKDSGGFFSLAFAKGYYVGDGKIPFDVVNYIFKMRDYLGKKIPKNDGEDTGDKRGDVKYPSENPNKNNGVQSQLL